ncbi:class Ib ribonucleoside-diphosphate reductase assembly flavoprotein NrdI [Deinococcus arcticus]|uniref:Class Ib ribonucleoside-diphosphate reductase assembly flavoprotein NrdI n=1 Tax=Deinococcus arcticus TaxID=2136176 RepID=A0A2T3WCT4_9DEIO|nr:class Ib ribonucleoside-diphosphate reductase assembly flavoprotein NrdI [Deinococcus arcticus]PTA69652.1 class Ib ribonucleoside-diphosphate reductase assembly flavoprotein NrdI [Deinococcus arcticus]
MLLVVDSLTGNVRRFAQALAQEAGGLDLHEVRQGAPAAPYLLLTYTFGQGQVPASTQAFLALHGAGLRGVVASGSYHWGDHFARAGSVIAAQFRVPLVARINKAGTTADRAQVAAWVRAQVVPTVPHPHSPERSRPWTPGLN